MSRDAKPFHERIQSGQERGIAAALLRLALAVAEPPYAAVTRARNLAYNREWLKRHRLPRPTIAIGNLTTGGTGKTPVVRWLAEQFIHAGKHPAVLMRGYRAARTGGSDEQRMLETYLANRATVIANPDRLAGATEALKRQPNLDLFILDDAFQHRRIQPEFNLLLVSVTNPFGYDHVLPRGLLREPMSGAARAHAVLLTRCDEVTPTALAQIKTRIALLTAAPIYHSRHTITRLLRDGETIEMSEAASQRLFCFCGIANPESFYASFPNAVGTKTFADHHAYTAQDLNAIRREASSRGATLLVTTEKDFVKLAPLPPHPSDLPLCRAQLEIHFPQDEAPRLLSQINAAIASLST